MTLGVVVPCYRQETYLARTMRALEHALEGLSWRGVLVMSAPGSVTPQHSAAWTVIAPPVTRPLTPGAARMVGFAACEGEWVLFVDADMEVDADWVRAALARAAGDAALGGLTGRIEEWFITDVGERPGSPDLVRVGHVERPVDHLVIVALYRRDALLAAGGYEPRLRSEEDFELGMRLRRGGFELLSLGRCAGRHWSGPRPSFAELARRWSTGLCFGQGQVLRLYLGRPGFTTLLKRQGLYVVTLAGWAAGIVALVLAAGGARMPIALWGAAALLGFAAMSVKKRSPRFAAYSVMTWTVNGLGMVVGLLRGLEPEPEWRGGEAVAP